MLNSRCIEIKSDEDKFVDELSNKYSVSKRMIRYDIDSINDFLRSNNIKEIEKRPKSPLKIDLREKYEIIKLLDDLDRESYILSTEERIGIIIYELLSSQEGCTYQRLQEILFVSKSTIVLDIKKVKEWLQDYDLSLIKYSNKGIKIIGDESDIRKALTVILVGGNKYNILKILEKIYSDENNSILNNAKNLNLSKEAVEYIEELIGELEDELGIFTDEDFMNVVFTVFVIIMRSKETRVVRYNKHATLKDKYRQEYKAVENIATKLLDRFGISIENDDIDYLISIIISMRKNEKEFVESKDYFVACSIANTICNKVEFIYGKRIKMDTDLYESFITHIKGLIFRLKFCININNEALSNIKSIYKNEFAIIKEGCEFLKEKFKCELSDDEIGFITLYICSAIEKNKEHVVSTHKRVLIVCSNGFATGRILGAKIRNNFEVEVIAITSVHAIDKYLSSEDIDLIISTVNIEKNYNIKKIIVSPIVNDEDMEKLKKFLKYKHIENSSLQLSEILNIIDNNCMVQNRANLINELSTYLENRINDNIVEDYQIPKEYIQLNLKADNWIEAIRLSSMPLLSTNVITEAYVKAMIENVNKLGAYIVVDEGIAIPHAKSNNTVRKSAFTINTFKTPIKIGEYNDIRIIFVLAVTDNDRKVDLITKMMSLIEDEEFIGQLLKADDSEVIYNNF